MTLVSSAFINYLFKFKKSKINLLKINDTKPKLISALKEPNQLAQLPHSKQAICQNNSEQLNYQTNSLASKSSFLKNLNNKNKTNTVEKISDWPFLLRPREKLLSLGNYTVSDAELLATLLGTGFKNCNAITFAQNLLTEFGSLQGLLSAPAAKLKKIHGIGPAKLARIISVTQLVKRSLEETLKKKPIFSDLNDVKNFLRLKIGSRPQEIFVCLYLNARNHLIYYSESAIGTINESNVYPREIAREALSCEAISVIVAHNHPSGSLIPSESDHLLTKQLKNSLSLIEINLIDHFIVTRGQAISFIEQGWL